MDLAEIDSIYHKDLCLTFEFITVTWKSSLSLLISSLHNDLAQKINNVSRKMRLFIDSTLKRKNRFANSSPQRIEI